MITLNFQLFYISIKAIQKLHSFYNSDIREEVFVSEYFKANPDVLPFLKSLFQLCFFNINQYYVIDCNGHVYQQDDGTSKWVAENVLQSQETESTLKLDSTVQRASASKTLDSVETIDR